MLLVVVALFAVISAAAAVTAGGPVVAQPQADPSPTLGSTESPNPNPPGSADSDPADYSGAIWVVVAAAVVVVLVAARTLYVFRGRRNDLGP